MIKIPFLNLTREYKDHQKEFNHAINTVLKSGRYLKGEQVKLFEQEFANYLGVSSVVATGSGTDAITLALLALGVKKNDRVIIPANSCHSLFGILHSGAIPLPMDVDSTTLNLDYKKLARTKLPKNTRAILFVHTYGNPAGLLEVAEFARRQGLTLIEDCAQAHGATIATKMTGSLGDLSIFSFYPTKNLACLSDGGALATNSRKLAQEVRLLSRHGERERFHIEQIGLTSNLDEIQSAILRFKLKHLDSFNRRRRALAKLYQSYLKNLPVTLPHQAKDVESVYYLYVIRTPKRQQLAKYLTSQGIATDIHYPIPLHLQKALSFLNFRRGDFPNAEQAAREVLSLPLYPYLKTEEVIYICRAIQQFFS